MPLSDRLALIVSADVSGAVRGFKQVGDTADRELGRATGGMDRMGARMRTVGAGMVTFGAVALLGLGKMAQASEEAELANIRLQNSVANNPRLSAASTAAFIEQAEALMKVTAADDDAIISGQAVLAQFGLEEDAILRLTPLMVDLARKKGIDLPTAALAMAKATDGSSTALMRMGINVDEVKFKIDPLGATIDALRSSVGGFAEQEGKTFAGQLEIMKNRAGELAEGIGVGVVDALTGMFDAGANVLDFMEDLAPGTQAAIGRFATFGATALVVGGALSTVGGWVIKARSGFMSLAVTMRLATAATNTTTASVTRLGVVMGVITAALVAVAAAYYGFKNAVSVSVDAQRAAQTSTEDLVATYTKWMSATGEMGELNRRVFTELAGQSIGTVIRLRDALAAQGVSVTELDAIIADVSAGQQQMNEDMAAGAAVSGDYAAATDAVTGALDAAAAAQTAVNDAIAESFDAVTTAAEEALNYRDALRDMEQGMRDANAAVLDQDSTLQDIEVAYDDAMQGVIDYGQQTYETYLAAGASAQESRNAQIGALREVANNPEFAAIKGQIDGLITEYESVPQEVHTTVTANTSQASSALGSVLSQIDRILNQASVFGSVNFSGSTPSGGGGYIPGYGGAQASGGDYMVNRPTVFVAGEAGPERATFTPMSEMHSGMGGGAGAGGHRTYNITVQSLDPATARTLVVAALKDYERSNGADWRS